MLPSQQAEDNDKTRERFDSIKKEEQDRKATIERYTQDVAKLEARVAQKPEEPDTRPINSELVGSNCIPFHCVFSDG